MHMQVKRNKEFFPCFPSAGRCPAISGKAIRAAWNTNAITPKIPHFLLPPPAFIAEHNVIGYGISLWWVGVSCPGSVPSQYLVHPQGPRWRGGAGHSEGLEAVRALLSSSWDIPGLPALLWSQIQNTAPHQPLWGELTLSQTKPVQELIQNWAKLDSVRLRPLRWNRPEVLITVLLQYYLVFICIIMVHTQTWPC